MGLKILTLSLLVTILIFSTLIYGQSRPEERCLGDGTSVCLNCVTRGTCILNPDGISYSVIYSSLCPTTPVQTYCDDSISDPGFYGVCSALPESATNCSCSSLTQCVADPNDPSAILHCESSPPPVTDPSCPSGAVDLTTCSCSLSCPPGCPLVDDPDDTCANFFICSGDDLIRGSCTDGFCFDQMSCGCVERTTPTTPFTCPTDCQLVDNPNGDCASYFFCGTDPPTQLSCPTSSCFDQASCSCKDITCPINGCPFVDDPNDDCGKYFLCNGDYLIPQSCSGSLCFDQVSCGCIDKGGSSSTTTTTTTVATTITITTTTNASICTADCPYVDNPSPDQCGDFYVCDGNNLVPVVCPGVLCFDQALCVCV